MTMPPATSRQWRTVLRFLLAVAVGNLVWEVAQVPLYTLWLTESGTEIAYAVLHCSAGDVLIAAISLALAVLVFGRGGWPNQRYGSVAIATVLVALGYTVFSEWLNVELRGSWAYRDLMPRVPWIGTGLTPILQWMVVPAAAFWWARRL
ncbi:MAG: hypothetical protein FD150_605 [Rhodobacteraceae bacterium]|nr:MAG: hypothetical protein FD150_605 [Paracoccaceae bacterium]